MSLTASYLESRNLFDRKCAACHDRDRCLSRKKTHGNWLQTVKKMALRSEGGIDRDEALIIADYLSVVCPAGEQP